MYNWLEISLFICFKSVQKKCCHCMVDLKSKLCRYYCIPVSHILPSSNLIRSWSSNFSLPPDVKEWRLAWGPSFEPAWAQINLCLNLLNKPSVDPSPPLPFWDKIRLLYHGRLVASIEQMNLYWLAMKNPYQTTELLDWEWRNFYMDWQNGKVSTREDNQYLCKIHFLCDKQIYTVNRANFIFAFYSISTNAI